MIKDYIRQSLNLIFGSVMWLCSSLNLFFEGARSPAQMSDANDSLLVPYGIAFSIWLPIFILCFGYAVLQALPKNRERALYRRIGGWSAAGFGGVCLWGLINAFAPMTPVDWALWGTAIIFVPTMLCLVKAMLIATAETPNMSPAERYTAHLGLSLIAGWCSLAVFLNWTPQIVCAFEPAGIHPAWICLALIALPITGWTYWISQKSNGNGGYLFPIIWGGAFVILARAKDSVGAELYLIALPLAVLIGLLSWQYFKPYNKSVSTRIFSRL